MASQRNFTQAILFFSRKISTVLVIQQRLSMHIVREKSSHLQIHTYIHYF